MRLRDRGGKQPCAACGRLTGFQYEIRTLSGRHIRWLDVCPDCGERPTLLTERVGMGDGSYRSAA